MKLFQFFLHLFYCQLTGLLCECVHFSSIKLDETIMLRDFLERWLQFAVCKFLTNTPQQKKTAQIIQKNSERGRRSNKLKSCRIKNNKCQIKYSYSAHFLRQNVPVWKIHIWSTLTSKMVLTKLVISRQHNQSYAIYCT